MNKEQKLENALNIQRFADKIKDMIDEKQKEIKDVDGQWFLINLRTSLENLNNRLYIMMCDDLKGSIENGK